MRRFLTLVCLLCLAIPAGISISGCTRNPDANYCNGAGYGLKVTSVASITLSPATAGISIAYGQTRQVGAATATTCKGTTASAGTFTYGTTNNQLVDISPGGNICAGTWNRNTGGGIANYTICSPPNPLPSTGGLPYGTAFITASAESVTSNPVTVYVHAPVTSVSLVTTPISTSGSPLPAAQQCFSKDQQAILDAQACVLGANNQQYLLCAPASVVTSSSPSLSCNLPAITPDIIAGGTFIAPPAFNGSLTAAEYESGGTITGTDGQTCTLSGFNNGSNGASATVALTGTNTIASGTSLTITAVGSGATAPPTTATLSNGTATCSGTVTLVTGPILGAVGQTCNLSLFNNGSVGATATVALTAANTIAGGTPLSVTAGGISATAPPTSAQLSNGSAICSGTASVSTTLTPVPNCTSSIGTLNYSVGTSTVASIATNNTTNVVTITAGQPGTTAITASVAGSGSSAGYFSTCPPQSISLTLEDDATSGTINQGVTQNLKTTTIDTNGNTITGLALTYQSTNPIDISAGSAGSITTNFPGVASIYALCQPPGCNPAPINEIGIYGTGLPIASNPVTITTQGTASDYVWFAAPGQSQYIIPVQLLTGTVGSTVRLPYVPNSMVMDQLGDSIYLGSPHELMIFSPGNNSLAKQDPSAPGVVLAVSPNNAQLLINDQQRQLFYIYSAASGASTTFGGMGNAAAWTADSSTLYITDNAALNNAAEGITGHTDTLYIYNQNTGWTTYPLPPSPLQNQLPPGLLPPNTPPNPLPSNVAFSSTMQTPAVTIPSVGAYLRGNPTVAHTWCPTGTVGNYAVGDYPGMVFYPQPTSDSLDVQTDALAATTDGHHILGAAITAGGFELSDIGIAVPTVEVAPEIFAPIPCPEAANSSTGIETLSALSTGPWLNATPTLDPTKVAATTVNQVIPSPQSNVAFITYTADAASTTAAQLPYYVPNSSAISSTTSAPGTLGYVPLVTQKGGVAPIAPLAGAFTPDDTLFFVSTAGDNMIHYISIPTTVSPSTPPTDTQQISPNLPACTPVSAGGNDLGCTFTGKGTIVPATAIAVKPRSTT
ncbi:MAG: hypothetical protein ABSE51_09140 [Terracidiphilus sp.]|jgi:hypothetical protein